MAEIILPAVQLSFFAWGNIAKALREHDDPHLIVCADEIDRQMHGLDDHFRNVSGEVVFKVTATLRPRADAVEG